MNKHLSIGPGGMNCRCCFPAPGSKDRRSQFRRAKKKADRIAIREAMADVEDEAQLILEIQRDLEYYSKSIEDTWDYIEDDDNSFFYDDEPRDQYYYDDEADIACWHCGAMIYNCRCDGGM